jgi:hypothetical protein
MPRVNVMVLSNGSATASRVATLEAFEASESKTNSPWMAHPALVPPMIPPRSETFCTAAINGVLFHATYFD